MTIFRLPAIFALGTVLATGPVFAHAKWVEIEDRTMLKPWNLTADAVENMNVMAGGRKIGEVEEVIGPDRTTPAALVVDLDDNAGYGHREDVAIPLANFTPAAGALTLSSDPGAVAAFQTYNH